MIPISSPTNPCVNWLQKLFREKVLNHTHEELPYAVAVHVDEFQEESSQASIAATVWVERSSQKGIIIGKGGSTIENDRDSRQD